MIGLWRSGWRRYVDRDRRSPAPAQEQTGAGRRLSWYPYPFLQVDELGYGPVVLFCAVITVLFLTLAAGVAGVDRLLAARSARRGALVRPEINA